VAQISDSAAAAAAAAGAAAAAASPSPAAGRLPRFEGPVVEALALAGQAQPMEHGQEDKCRLIKTIAQLTSQRDDLGTCLVLHVHGYHQQSRTLLFMSLHCECLGMHNLEDHCKYISADSSGNACFALYS